MDLFDAETADDGIKITEKSTLPIADLMCSFTISSLAPSKTFHLNITIHSI